MSSIQEVEADPVERRRARPVDRRVFIISALTILIGVAAGVIAQVLARLIAFVTNVSFLHRMSVMPAAPREGSPWGPWVIVVPAIGGVIVGLMARFGSKAIRGHGIPEAMEQILVNESRIPARITVLKPLSAAIAIGTGGPFGAEGPIIATGGALGSVIGQWMKGISAHERKTLLAAGAAAGMAATFGSPVSAVLLAIELLLFEFRPRSVIPVALACAAAGAMRISFVGKAPAFAMPVIDSFSGSALAFYTVLGLASGIVATGITHLVYAIEDWFEELPIHWMWWPGLAGLFVGLVGYFFPRTLGVGYDNIEVMLSGSWTAGAVAIFCLAKLASWSVSLSSGTSGGTLAPLLTIGGGFGALFGIAGTYLFPGMGIDVRIAALVGMAAVFAGASRALLASAVFAFETTRQTFGLLPLIAGCSASYLVSAAASRSSIMTEKILRRGVEVPEEYRADELAGRKVLTVATRDVQTINGDLTVMQARDWLTGLGTKLHQAFPVVENNRLVGVITRREIMGAAAVPDQSDSRVRELIGRPPVVITEHGSLREAFDLMAHSKVGRLPVVRAGRPDELIGIITRSDLLKLS